MTERRPEPLPEWAAEVRRVYRDSVSEQMPAPELDAAILAASRREVGARPQSASRQHVGRWGAPFAAAAVIVIASSLLVLLHEERRHETVLQDGPAVAPVPVPVPVPATAPAATQAVPAGSRAPSDAPSLPRAAKHGPAGLAPAAAPLPRVAAPEMPSLQSGPAVPSDVVRSAAAPDTVAPAPEVEAVAPVVAPAARSVSAPPGPIDGTLKSRSEAPPSSDTAPTPAAASPRASGTPRTAAPALRSPSPADAEALAAVLELWDAGRHDEARDRLNELRCNRPGISIPPDYPVARPPVPRCAGVSSGTTAPADDPPRR